MYRKTWRKFCFCSSVCATRRERTRLVRVCERVRRLNRAALPIECSPRWAARLRQQFVIYQKEFPKKPPL